VSGRRDRRSNHVPKENNNATAKPAKQLSKAPAFQEQAVSRHLNGSALPIQSTQPSG